MEQNKRERVMAAVEGREGDRVPVSFWYHFPLDHPSGEPLAQAEIAFARKYDPDFLKVMHDLKLDLPDGMTSIEDPKDWNRVRPVGGREGNFAEQIKALKLIRSELGEDMPIIDTVFNPYATANKLCGKDLMTHLRANPSGLRRALEAITVSLADYAAAWIEEGGDGIFYALDGAQATNISREEYREIFMPLDQRILEAAMEKGTLNVLHLHGADLMFDMLYDLPAHVLNWSSETTYPSLAEARGLYAGCIAGGINEIDILGRTPAEILAEGRSAIAKAGRGGFILTPGCAIPTETPEESIIAIRKAVEYGRS